MPFARRLRALVDPRPLLRSRWPNGATGPAWWHSICAWWRTSAAGCRPRAWLPPRWTRGQLTRFGRERRAAGLASCSPRPMLEYLRAVGVVPPAGPSACSPATPNTSSANGAWRRRPLGGTCVRRGRSSLTGSSAPSRASGAHRRSCRRVRAGAVAPTAAFPASHGHRAAVPAEIPAPQRRLPGPITNPDTVTHLNITDVTASPASSTSMNMPPDLHGRDSRHPQRREAHAGCGRAAPGNGSVVTPTPRPGSTPPLLHALPVERTTTRTGPTGDLKRQTPAAATRTQPQTASSRPVRRVLARYTPLLYLSERPRANPISCKNSWAITA
jgi:hypothetical protein